MAENSTRTLRTRRVVALMAWAGLLVTAYWLANARYTGSTRLATPPPLAFVLSAFTAFVGVFAWMLYNPARRSAVESPTLSLAAAATLFPPPIIGFCLLAPESPLRGWLALGMFLLIVIAILSHVPDEFFGVPRNRYSYFMPIPAFDGVVDEALDPDAAWFRTNDLSAVVPDLERPSLAPKAYLQTRPERTRSQKAEIRPASDVDDILTSEIDISLLDDPLWDINDGDTPSQPKPVSTDSQTSTSGRQSSRQNNPTLKPKERSENRRRTSHQRSDQSTTKTVWGPTHDTDLERTDQNPKNESRQSNPALSPRTIGSRSDGVKGEPVKNDIPRDSSGTSVVPPSTEVLPERETEEEDSFELPRSASLLTHTPPATESDHSDVESKSSAERSVQPATRFGIPQLERTTEAGTETVEGVMTVRFDKGQKRANLHVPFSPPLMTVPEVECECVGTEPLRLKVPVKQAYGIRIEARRSNADEALETEVGFSAVSTTD